MGTYQQAERALRISTPLGRDALLLVGFAGDEAISRLFRLDVDLLAANETRVPFDALLGQRVSLHLDVEGSPERHFSGVCSRVAQGHRDATFTAYRLEVVPELWFLTRRAQSRIFQHQSVPEILRACLEGLNVEYQLDGTYHPRDYCVQYRETDFAFVSRLMEEEGIFYFFRHEPSTHVLVLADAPRAHPELPGTAARMTFDPVEGGQREASRVTSWVKSQELRSGKVTLWDHCFELPDRHLEADATLPATASAGTVTHRLAIGRNERLERYDYPGGYAQRFDGVDRRGADRPGDLDHIFEDNARTARVRLQEEAAQALRIEGAGGCGAFASGHRFRLASHFDADGAYLLTAVSHAARLDGDYRSGNDVDFIYQNTFTCIPEAVPFRPVRATPRPAIHGTQTAVVVGPPGEEIYPDKYGRVKVQFHWDREGGRDLDSSCWIRVATPWAGSGWGMVHIPRIGQEVVVAFEEGDPDRPIIVGSVYNPAQGVPFGLPAGKAVSGLKSQTPKGGGYNELTFDDTAGQERITIHGQHDMNTTVEHDQATTVHNNRTATIDNDDTETVGANQAIKVGGDQSQTIGGDQTETIGGSQTLSISGARDAVIGGAETLNVGGSRTATVGGSESVTVASSRTTTIGSSEERTVGGSLNLTVASSVTITAGTEITLLAGGSSIKLGPSGITITSPSPISIVGAIVKVNT
jgi:type VI secretion system secreted protein VgrG